MFNKVEICGVNTASLKVIPDSRKKELLQIIRNGTEEEKDKAREEMVNGNLRLVLSVIQRFAGRGENPDDLFQVGCIGLIKAIDNFNPDMEVKFSTYGVPMIIGEVRRYLRDYSSLRVSRSIKDTAYKALQAKEKIISETGREPTIDEIAKAIDVPSENVVIALEATYEPVSIYEPVYSDDSDTVYLMDTLGDNNDDNKWLDHIALKEAVRGLGEREKKILTMRYMKGKTQIEVAEEIGISQAQVSRLEKTALKRIKEQV
ncbi:MAG: RNA polymerase sporulation sigma factor SigG [Clostridia bacterium]|nr:RNA polymerase sporulation sigma factor SigG [Clostridia bacterium]